jgi:hypothetical protein
MSPLPPDIVPSEDLTERARTSAGTGPFPFDEAREYDPTFDGIARILHRGLAHHGGRKDCESG